MYVVLLLQTCSCHALGDFPLPSSFSSFHLAPPPLALPPFCPLPLSIPLPSLFLRSPLSSLLSPLCCLCSPPFAFCPSFNRLSLKGRRPDRDVGEIPGRSESAVHHWRQRSWCMPAGLYDWKGSRGLYIMGCMYKYICIIYIYIYIYIYMYVCVHMSTCVGLYIYIYMCTWCVYT